MDLAVLHGLYIPCAQTGLYIHHVIESLIQRLLQHRERANVIWAEEAPVLLGRSLASEAVTTLACVVRRGVACEEQVLFT